MNEHNVRAAFDGRTLCVLFIRRHTSKNFVHAQKSSTYCANNNVCQRMPTYCDELKTNSNRWANELPRIPAYVNECKISPYGRRTLSQYVKLRLHYNELAQRTATVWRYLIFVVIRWYTLRNPTNVNIEVCHTELKTDFKRPKNELITY